MARTTKSSSSIMPALSRALVRFPGFSALMNYLVLLMPNDDMTILSMIHFLRRGVLLVSLLALVGCTVPGAGGSRDGGAQAMGGGERPPGATSSAPAQPSAGKSVSTPAAPGSAAEVKEKLAESARIFRGSGVLLKPPRAEKASTEPADVSLNFEAADIRDIAKTVLAEILQESYIVDPRVQGSISFRTTRPLPRSALLPTLETVLRMNGIVLVKEGGIFKIMPAAAVRGSVSPKMGGVFAGYTVQIVPLKFLGAKEMARLLEPFAPDASAIKVDEQRNLLILAGTQNEIGHMLDTVDLFDVDWLSGMSVGLFTLRSADVKTVDAELNKIIGDKNLNPLAGVVRFIPIERLNGFVIITPQPHYLEQAKLWLERLDQVGGTGGGVRLFVYYVQNGKAEYLAGLLTQTFGRGGAATARPTPAPSLAPGLAPTNVMSSGQLGSPLASTGGVATQAAPAAMAPMAGATLAVSDDSGGPAGEVRVVADKENNALLILATTAGYEKIEAALKKLDTTPRQVLIEVTIVEVTLTDQLKYGLEWQFSGGRGGGLLDMGGGLKNVVPGFSYARVATDGTVQAMLNMLASNNQLNVLSSPHIMVADNQTAKIQVGDSVPIAGPTTVVGTNTVSSVQYLDTGVILSVTPHINAGGLVNMDITQEVSVPSATTTSGLNSPTVSKRSAKTMVTVQSGETTVLGGLISEQSTAGSSGLPFLSSIPILGGLFGTQNRNNTKTELVVLITPRVANTVGQAKMVSDEFRKKMKEAENLMDCGISNALGYTTRGGLWCLQPRPLDGKTDRPLDP
jgi:general secretion pathway protein D